MALVDIFMDIFEALDGDDALHIEMTLVLEQEPSAMQYNPAIIHKVPMNFMDPSIFMAPI